MHFALDSDNSLRHSTFKHRCLVDKLQDRVTVAYGLKNAVGEASQTSRLTIPHYLYLRMQR